MSLFATMDVRFTFTVDLEDGRCALMKVQPEYPTSSARDEPSALPQSSNSSASASMSSAVSAPSRSYAKYPLPDWREVCPGVLATRQLTENHPLVNTYIDALARIMPRRAPFNPTVSSASSPATTSHQLPVSPATPSPGATLVPQQSPLELTHWLAHHAGIASTLTVSNVISQQFQLFPGPTSHLYAAEVPKLTQQQKEAILALAALRVLNHPTHPAHFALWGKNILHRTAQVVDAVLETTPCPIVSRVGWIGLPENIWALEGLQSIYVPPAPQKKTGGMTLRKRKAPATTATQAAEDEVEGRANTRKRARTTRASQRAKEAEAAQAAEAVPTATEVPEEESPASLLFASGGPSVSTSADAPVSDLFTTAVKQELIAASPVLQAIGLMLDLPDRPIDMTDLPSPLAAPSSTAEPTASPTATRRSTRARRKPAPPGPVSLTSTPLSALSTPLPVDSPLPSSEKTNRSGSRGSSTAVSEGGYPSEEGTVVDVDVNRSTSASAKGKRKAVEIEEAVVELAESVQNANAKGGSKRKAKSTLARKRAKVEDVSVLVEVATTVTLSAVVLELQAGGEENVNEGSPAPVPTTKKRKTAAASGGRRKATRKA